MDDPEALPPQGEFFCQDRASWMPEIPGKLAVMGLLIELNVSRYFPKTSSQKLRSQPRYIILIFLLLM